MKRQLQTILFLFCMTGSYAQPLGENLDIRIYEHHSSSRTGQAFGNGANGDRSGYDFVNHEHVYSFDQMSFKGYPSNSPTVASIDLVEHNGPFTSAGVFGFTAGISTIWESNGAPYIRGNELTKYVEAPAGFDYSALTDVSQIVKEYEKGTPSFSIESVKPNAVYLAKIRNTDQYVAMKITNIVNDNGATMTDVYFRFDYKYGTYVPSANAIALAEAEKFDISQDAHSIRVSGGTDGAQSSVISLFSIDGKKILSRQMTDGDERIDTHRMPPGVYILVISLPEGAAYSRKVVTGLQ